MAIKLSVIEEEPVNLTAGVVQQGGGGGGGYDLPTFTFSIDYLADGTPVISSCDKTFEECAALLEEGYRLAVGKFTDYWEYEGEEYSETYYEAVPNYDWFDEYIIYRFQLGDTLYQFYYYADGTFSEIEVI